MPVTSALTGQRQEGKELKNPMVTQHFLSVTSLYNLALPSSTDTTPSRLHDYDSILGSLCAGSPAFFMRCMQSDVSEI